MDSLAYSNNIMPKKSQPTMVKNPRTGELFVLTGKPDIFLDNVQYRSVYRSNDANRRELLIAASSVVAWKHPK